MKSMPLSTRENRRENTVLDINGVKVGGKRFVVIAGPCAVETEDQVLATARAVKAAGAALLRGGAYKPRTSPYSFQGLRADGLKILARAREETGLGVVTEVMDARHLDQVSEVADVLQVGSRNMQNFTLLDEVGRCRKPVLLKRGMAATVEEFLMAAERVAAQGNREIMLCERGIRTFETTSRNTLDLNAVTYLKKESHLPVIVDPSHGTGHWWMVPHLSRAAVAVGGDGLIIEVHPEPEKALCDGPQSLRPQVFDQLMREIRSVAGAMGREV